MPDYLEDEGESVWYRLGYSMEQARGIGEKARDLGEKARDLGERAPELAARMGSGVGRAKARIRSPRQRRLPPGEQQVEAAVGAEIDPPPQPGLHGMFPVGEPWEGLMTAGAAALVGKLLGSVPRRRHPGMMALARAGAAGAAAALLREVVRPWITGQSRDEPLMAAARNTALAGAARGLLYGGLIDPRVPGPPLVRGAAFGLIEHLVSPWGGLTEIAGPRAPHRALPFLAEIFDDFEPSDDTLVDHLVFGIALAAMYGAAAEDEDWDDDDD